jgi:predicted O-methyltransferase YrrM
MIGKTVLHTCRVMLGCDEPQTQTTEPERQLLARFLPGHRRIVEIGVFEGFTTRLLAQQSDPEATIYGVDPFYSGRLGVSWGLLIAKHHNRRHLASEKVVFVRALSTEVGDRIPCPVNFVFVDGDHSLEGIKADWDFWSNRISADGIIAMHDTALNHEAPESTLLGSHKYFRDHISQDPRFQVVAQINSLSILQAKS